MAAMMKTVLLLFFVTLTYADKDKVFVDRAMLDEAMSKIQENDDFMTMIKLMMSNGTQRFKVETRRLVEYGDASPESNQETDNSPKIMTSTVHDDVMPLQVPNPRFRNTAGRVIGGFTDRSAADRVLLPIFNNKPTIIKAAKIATGNVGLCKTIYKIETINTAIMMKTPEAPKQTLAHSIPIAVGRCQHDHPPTGAGSLQGKCVLAAQAHIAWILVPTKDVKKFNNCVTIPGVSSLQKCPDWIIVGGRCVFDTEM